MRSLVMALLDVGREKPAEKVGFDDADHLANLERARAALPHLPGSWTGAAQDEAATRDLLDAMRSGSIADASEKTLEQLQSGRSQAQGIWDAVHLAAGELMMRKPGIFGIHTVTSINSLHYAFRTAATAETRLDVLLHAVAWMGRFREIMSRGGNFGATKITELKPAEVSPDEAVAAAETFELVGKNPPGAAARAFALAQKHPQPDAYAGMARKVLFRKGTDAHHYKYAAAILEDYGLVSPAWRPHLLATSVYYFKGSKDPDSRLMQQAVEAVRKV